MARSKVILATGLCFLPSAMSQGGAYSQCGGTTGGQAWTGATTCVSGYTCVYSSPYYSQCLPGTATTTIASSTTASGTSASSTTTTAPASSSSGGLGSPSPTLLSGYYWVRAVESPNFHSYLQSSPPQETGLAVLDSYTTAGQFNIDSSGRLIQVLGDGSLLYGIVETPTNASVKLSLTWDTSSSGTIGTFAWQGDGLSWTIPSVSRPNNIAWLVCEDQHAYINLGPYAYDTPTGCVDETIHYYNGATAVD